MKTTLAFLLAMDYEINSIFEPKYWKVEKLNPFKVLRHRQKRNLVIIRMGVGKVNAASAVQFTLDRYDPEKIINIGVVGCINNKIKLGEVRKIFESRFFDVDITPLGCKLGQIYGCKVSSYKLKIGKNDKKTKIVTGDTFLTDTKKIEPIINAFSPDFVDMEIGAICHTLYLNGKLNRLSAFKAPSDYSDSSAAKDFKNNQKIAFQNLREVASDLIKSYT